MQKVAQSSALEILPETYLLTLGPCSTSWKCVLSQLTLIGSLRELGLLPMGIFRLTPSQPPWAMLGP